MRRLEPAAALLWGLQFALLNPALALILVALYDASAAEVGLVLTIYNVSGFVASIAIPAHADRSGDDLSPMLVCGLLTFALAGVLAVVTSLHAAVVALVVLGGPAGVGVSLLFAHLKRSGAAVSTVVNTRAVVSFAWVAGPALATLVMSSFGPRAVLGAIGLVAVLNVVITVLMRRREARGRSRGPVTSGSPAEAAAEAAADGNGSTGRLVVVSVLLVFVALQATNAAVVSVMGLFVTESLGLNVAWSGIALGVSAGLEIPALLLLGRLTDRVSSDALLVSGCIAGIGYYAAMAGGPGVRMLLALQVLNAWFFAVVAGVGLALFQELIPRPGLASGLYTNTRRVGAIASGPIIGLGSTSALGYGGVFVASAVLTGAALAVIVGLRWAT